MLLFWEVYHIGGQEDELLYGERILQLLPTYPKACRIVQYPDQSMQTKKIVNRRVLYQGARNGVVYAIERY